MALVVFLDILGVIFEELANVVVVVGVRLVVVEVVVMVVVVVAFVVLTEAKLFGACEGWVR